MTFRVAFWWGLLSVVCFVFVEAVKSRPVGDDICRIVKRGECNCQCAETRSTTWGSLADLYKRLFIRSFAPVELEMECSKCVVECKRYINDNCLNGKCNENGCECAPCWKGKSCDQPANDHPPQFEQESYKAQLSNDVEPGSVVVTTSANDEDTKQCVQGAACPCGDIIYSITSGNEAGLFTIEKHSGNLRVVMDLESHSGASFELTVAAQNEGGKLKTSAKVFITVSETTRRQRRSVEHHIVRRSTPLPSPSGIIVSNPVVHNNTFYKPGDKITFNLTVSHNQSVATAQPDTNLNFKCSSKYLSINDAAFLSKSGPAVTNRAVANGELTFTAAAFPKSAVLTVKFEVTVKPNIHPLANLYLACEAVGVQSGASYKIGPVASTPTLYGVFPKVTLVRLTSPAQSLFDVDTVLQYRMTIDMPYLNFPLLVEATSAINDFSFMPITEIKVTKTGSNIGAGSDGILNPTPKYHKSSSDLAFYDRVTLNFKNLTVSAESDVNNKIVIEWKVTLSDHPLVVNGSKYWSGAGLSSGFNMLHVAQQAVYTKKIQPTLACAITARNNTANNRFSIDDVLLFDFECNHTNTSTANAKNVKLQFYSNYLIFESATYTLPGGSSTAATKHNDTVLNDILVAAMIQGANIIGTLNMKVGQTMIPLAELDVFVKLFYQNEADKDKMTTTHKPKPPPIAAVPIISLNISNPLSCYKVGSIIDMEFKVLLRKINAPLRVEIIAPVNASSPIMTIVSVSTPLVGANIMDSANLAAKPIICRSTVNDTINDRCTIDFGTAKSIVGLANLPINEISIKFKVVLNDHPVVQNGSKYWPAVGVRGGSRMMWIGEVAVVVCSSADPKPVLKLESNCYVPGTSQSCCNGNLKKGDKVQFNITVSHDKQYSEQYADQLKIVHMLPPYVIFDKEVLKRPSRLNYVAGPELTDSKPLRFLDDLSFSYIATLDPEGKMPTGDVQAVSIAEVTYVGHDKSTVFSRKTGVCCTYNNPSDPSAEGKPSVEPPFLPEYYNRGFLLISSSQTFVVCSENLAKTSCFYTSDGGTSWTAMSEQVGRVIGHVGETLYAISNNKRAYMKQDSRGENWYAITEEEWKKVKASASDDLKLKTVPDGETNINDPTIVLKDGSSNAYGGNKHGVYFRSGSAGAWKQRALWKCCGAL